MHSSRSTLADVLADIKNSRSGDESAPTPAKRRMAVNYVALSGHTPRQSRSTSTNNIESKTSATTTTPKAKAYKLKLIGRTLDLAQFSSSNLGELPLYVLCRSWVGGHQLKSSARPTLKVEESNRSSPQESLNEAGIQVDSLPPPTSKADLISRFNITSNNGDIDLRIPESVREFKPPKPTESDFDKFINSMNHQECFQLNKERWRKVRREWSDARTIYQSRYENSFNVIDEIYKTQQRAN